MALGLDTVFSGINVGDKVSSFKESTNKTLAGYKGNVVQAISPIQNKLKEGVASVKATESKVQKVITGYKDEVVNNLNGIIGTLSGGLLDFNDAKKYVSIGKNGISLDKQGVIAAMGSKIGLDLTSNAALMYQMTNLANDEFNDLTGGYFGNMVSTDGKGFRITENWRSSLGNGFIDMLGRTTGVSTSLFDNTFNTSYYNSLLKMSAQYGMSDSYEAIMAKYTYPEDAVKALINAIPNMMQNGDLISMNKVLTLVTENKYAVINAKYPYLISSLFQNFSLDPGTSVGEYPGIKAMFLKVCISIFGVNWYKRETAFGMIYNLGLVSSVSDDLKKVIMSDETYPDLVPFLACAGIFNEQDSWDVFKSNFTDVPILTE